MHGYGTLFWNMDSLRTHIPEENHLPFPALNCQLEVELHDPLPVHAGICVYLNCSVIRETLSSPFLQASQVKRPSLLFPVPLCHIVSWVLQNLCVDFLSASCWLGPWFQVSFINSLSVTVWSNNPSRPWPCAVMSGKYCVKCHFQGRCLEVGR